MGNDQIIQEIDYLISRGVPPAVEGVLCALKASLACDSVEKMLHFLAPFCRQQISNIQEMKARRN